MSAHTKVYIKHAPGDCCTMIRDASGRVTTVTRDPRPMRGATVVDAKRFWAAFHEEERTQRAIKRMRFWDKWAPWVSLLGLMACTSAWVVVGYGLCVWVGWMK